MDEDKRVLLAACGLYCGACYHYRASFYGDERLRVEAALRAATRGVSPARAAARMRSIFMQDARSARSGPAQTGEASRTAACARTFPVRGYGPFKAMAACTTKIF